MFFVCIRIYKGSCLCFAFFAFVLQEQIRSAWPVFQRCRVLRAWELSCLFVFCRGKYVARGLSFKDAEFSEIESCLTPEQVRVDSLWLLSDELFCQCHHPFRFLYSLLSTVFLRRWIHSPHQKKANATFVSSTSSCFILYTQVTKAAGLLDFSSKEHKHRCSTKTYLTN